MKRTGTAKTHIKKETTNSEIKRTYLGLTLGKNTRTDVINFAKGNSYDWEDDRVLHEVKIFNVLFGNMQWDKVHFVYGNNNGSVTNRVGSPKGG